MLTKLYNYLVKIEYDGKHFHGVVPQPGVRTVLGEIFESLNIEFIRYNIVSRTDKGVSAKENYFVVSTKNPVDWKEFYNKYIKIKRVYSLKNYINLRKYAISKRYVYKLPYALFDEKYIYKPKYIILDNNNKITLEWEDKEFDINLYKTAAKIFIGNHDFSNFAKGRVQNAYCRILRFDIIPKEDYIENIIEGNRFLYEMIRKIISFLVAVGKGRFPIDKILIILSGAKLDPKPPSAPPEYLILDKIILNWIEIHKFIKDIII